MSDARLAVVKMTRNDFCKRMLAFCCCLLGIDILDCQALESFDQKANELLYFLRQIPNIRDSSVCFIGSFSQDLLLSCFKALGESNVRFLLRKHKIFLLRQPGETLNDSVIYKGFCHHDQICPIGIEAFEKAGFENLLSIVYDAFEDHIVSDATLRQILKASKSSIVVTGAQRVASCTFLPVESRTWNGKVMTVGERAVIVTAIGKNENEIG